MTLDKPTFIYIINGFIEQSQHYKNYWNDKLVQLERFNGPFEFNSMNHLAIRENHVVFSTLLEPEELLVLLDMLGKYHNTRIFKEQMAEVLN